MLFNSKSQESPEAEKLVTLPELIVSLTNGTVGARGKAAQEGVTRFSLSTSSKEHPNTVTIVGNSTYAKLGKRGNQTLVEIVPSDPNDPGSAVSVLVSPPNSGSKKIWFDANTDKGPLSGTEDYAAFKGAVEAVTALTDAYIEGEIAHSSLTSTQKNLAVISLGAVNFQRPQ